MSKLTSKNHVSYSNQDQMYPGRTNLPWKNYQHELTPKTLDHCG